MFILKGRELMRRIFLSLLFVVSLLIITGCNTKAMPVDDYNYLALGDSIAEGYLFNGAIGNSYADYLASDCLPKNTNLNKHFAITGATSNDLLEDLQENEPYIENEETYFIEDAIKNADLITLTIGANDLLDIVEFDMDNYSMSYNIGEVFQTLLKLHNNLDLILTNIRALNDTVPIYVTSYYFPFSKATGEQVDEIQPYMQKLFELIKLVTISNEAHYVDISYVVKGHHLPNAYDIHPNEEGYKAIANAICEQIK